MPGVPAGKPGHPSKGGGRRVRCFLHPQPQALPTHRDYASGRPGARPLGPGRRLRTDLPGYRVYRGGELVEQRGSPEAIGIADLGRPDYGDPVPIHPGEVPVFWACGVTPQAVALEAHPEFMITHEPGIMFQTDLPREGDTN